ncbi:heterokaryon incompatibility protein-domain-containing protein [Immersiella caudata]|uniref:Heterokaryon incompatibility protein-domain-containing protein n=1 Tax=Immersiella caudata TaxID=314043 RepID=A0AA39WJI7_9PEZI|nr:heterokaryon incompatibility protein-domain-containing protein [Immersiella caudata]
MQSQAESSDDSPIPRAKSSSSSRLPRNATVTDKGRKSRLPARQRQKSAPAEPKETQAPQSRSYEPLPDGNYIRLLQIAQPTTSSASETISVKLTPFPLDAAPRFWALSYTWGPPRYGPEYEHYETTRRTIECNGRPVEISENLYQFLLQARDSRLFIHQDPGTSSDTPESREPFAHLSQLPRELVKSGRKAPGGSVPLGRDAYLWVDALCIDQNNLAEKSLQVGMMGSIYGSAERVLIWLGPRKPSSDVMWAMEEFTPALYSMVSGDANGFYKKRSLALTDHIFIRELGEEACERWMSSLYVLVSFFSRSCWFSRGWVAQEAFALPVDSVAVLAGGKAIRFEQVLQLIRILDHHFSFSGLLPIFSRGQHSDPDDKGFWADSSTLTDLRRFALIHNHLEINKSTDRPWEATLGLLDKMSALKFADARDHVYGCLGLIRMMLGEVRNLMNPDYGVAPEEVFKKTAVLILRGLPNLDVFFSFLGRHEEHGPNSRRAIPLPSWVPDFSTRKRENTLFRPLRLDCSSSPSQEPFAEIKEDALLVEGVCYDTISDGMYIGGVSARRHLRGDWLLDYLFRDGPYPFGNQTREAAMLETLSVASQFQSSGSLSAARSAREWYALTLSRCFLEEEGDIDEFFASKISSLQGPRPWLPTSDMVLKMMGLDDARFLEARNRNDWHQLTKSNTVGRSIFETKKGHLVLSPRVAKSRDEIWLMRGSRLPIILRPDRKRQGCYTILGVAYVHRLEVGKAMGELSPNFQRIGLV